MALWGAWLARLTPGAVPDLRLALASMWPFSTEISTVTLLHLSLIFTKFALLFKSGTTLFLVPSRWVCGSFFFFRLFCAPRTDKNNQNLFFVFQERLWSKWHNCVFQGVKILGSEIFPCRCHESICCWCLFCRFSSVLFVRSFLISLQSCCFHLHVTI